MFKILLNRLKCIDNRLGGELLSKLQSIRPIGGSRFQYDRAIYVIYIFKHIVNKYLPFVKKAINRIKYFHMTANLV